ncbi:hypothetical protein FOZ62_018745 [Perkinsus olseni]|uniref:Uncharacterized protein n=1 Tax=Perkinsus olseni TaxID=32597 RepID=A0A7J6QMY8_PEROL|nr:hypothetical protein FOZ62_018745 [Perkinsus olseni]
MDQSSAPLGRRRYRRSIAARQRRNAIRRERHFRRNDLQDAVAEDKHAPAVDPFKLLRFYATTATEFRTHQKDKCSDDLSDGSAKPSACRWFQSDYSPQYGPQSPLPSLRSCLHDATRNVLADPGLRRRLLDWIQLPRENQSAETTTLHKLASTISSSADVLAQAWAAELNVSASASSTCSIRTDLLRALLLATKAHDELEDTLICDEIARGCHIGIDRPIQGTGLWPKDAGPKHTGYGLSISAASSWKNYRSCDPFTAEVMATLDDEASARKHHLHCIRVGPAVVQSARVFLDLLQLPSMASTTASQLLGWVSPDDSGAVVVADASLTGLGGVVFPLGSPHLGPSSDNVEWFHVTYADEPLIESLVPGDLLTSSDIGPLELLASVIGVVRALTRGFTTVTVLSDNVATVACLNRRRATSIRMNETMRRLRLAWPSLGYSVLSQHIKGEMNNLADFLSRSSSAERGDALRTFGREVDTHPILQQLVLALA